MIKKWLDILIVSVVAIAGIGVPAAYHYGLFNTINSSLPTQSNPTPPPTNTTNTNNSTSNNNSNPSDNVFITSINAFFHVTDSQGAIINFTENFAGFNMSSGNSTFRTFEIHNNNFFNFSLSRIELSSNGFDVENVSPNLPSTVNSGGSKNLTIRIFAQSGMSSFKGSIAMDMYCNRSTQVSISVVHALEMTRDTLNGTNMERNLTYTGYQTQSYATSKFIFTLHNNYTYALNISDVISTTPGFSITSCYPQLPFILIPNQSETFSLNVTTSTSIAGYFGEIKLQINTTSTLNITITSIHTSVSDNAFLGVPQVDQKIYGNMVAGANSTVMIELYNPYEYSAQVSGFVIETKGFVLVNSYPQIGSYPKTVTNGDSWFNLIIKPTMNMAGYSGGINIQIEDSP